ncbi:hypothetical protein GW17_00053269 [Ensete ventricosum]|nr:hypothetical protein GW17_00053269 [Ensete ventricosum]
MWGRVPFWSYAKLMLSCWLVLPYFNGAAYVYQHFVRPLFVNHQKVNLWYVPGKKDTFDKPDDLLSAAERYIKENGPEAFEKLISKVCLIDNLFSTFFFANTIFICSLKEHLNPGASIVPFWRRRKPWECLMLKENQNPGAKTIRSLMKIIDTEHRNVFVVARRCADHALSLHVSLSERLPPYTRGFKICTPRGPPEPSPFSTFHAFQISYPPGSRAVNAAANLRAYLSSLLRPPESPLSRSEILAGGRLHTAAISMGVGGVELKAPPDGDGSIRSRPLAHIQVRKIREEDLRIGDGAGEGLSARDHRFPVLPHDATGAVLCSRSARPSSPLGNRKAAIGSA